MRFGVRQEVWEWYFEPYSHRKSNIWFFFWIFCRRVPTVEVEAGAYMYQGDEAFSRNPLHDLESLCQWWEGLWFLLCHYQPRRLGTVPNHIRHVKKSSQTLFNIGNDLVSRRRTLTLTRSTLFTQGIPTMTHSPNWDGDTLGSKATHIGL